MRALLVILNKDNAVSLEKCLDSIARMDGLCEFFDVLILDGASRDNSEEIARRYEKEYPCIKFKVQERLGGTGYARREACDYAISEGYDAIVWGDSENVYSPRYMRAMVDSLAEKDAVGGVPVVQGDFYGHAFAWYHALHLVIPNLYRVHIPGNNKGERVEICEKVKYPETVRSEDYGFSLLLRKMGIRLNQDIAKDAVVHVSLPGNFKEVRAWQRARSKGVAQVLREIGVAPWDNLGWSMLFLLFIVFALLIPFSYLPLLLYSILFFLGSLWIFVRSARYIKEKKIRYFFAPAFGLLVYSIYSLRAVWLYIKIKK